LTKKIKDDSVSNHSDEFKQEDEDDEDDDELYVEE
jgi:hypothetical protein